MAGEAAEEESGGEERDAAEDGRVFERLERRGEAGEVLSYQRPEIARHIRQIREYLETADALLPNALVVAFDSRVRFSPAGKGNGCSRPGTLSIPLGGAEADKAVTLTVRLLDGNAVLYAPAPQTAYDESRPAERIFVATSPQPLPEPSIEERLAKELRFDPDAWVVETEDRAGRHFLELAQA